MENYELVHYGIKGMRWGIRRYQNPDGTLTDKGKKRYSEDALNAKILRKKSINKLSNAELKKLNERDQLEVTRRDLKKKKSVGRRAVQGFIATAGTITAVAAAAGVYKKYGKLTAEGIVDLTKFSKDVLDQTIWVL